MLAHQYSAHLYTVESTCGARTPTKYQQLAASWYLYQPQVCRMYNFRIFINYNIHDV